MNTDDRLKEAVELLGTVSDLSTDSVADRKTMRVQWRCRFCKDEANTPPEIKHKDGCLVVKIRHFLKSRFSL